MAHECEHEKDWGIQQEKNKLLAEHLDESPEYRDRLLNVERDFKHFRRDVFLVAFSGSIVGQSVPILGKVLEALLRLAGINLGG